MDPTHIAWAAGLFEGEGSIVETTRNRKFLEMSMTDKDVVQRFKDVVGVGTITQRDFSKYNPKYKVQYRWQVSSKAGVIFVLNKILPFLGNRRAYKALNILDSLECC